MAVALNPDFSLLENQKNIAVGLSGGGDSMALTHMLCHWAVENDAHIHSLTVDHGLRDDSAQEADLISSYIHDFPNLTHHILKWDHGNERPDTAIMEKARHARYSLMNRYCQENNIQTLTIAHHGDDQLETFLFRLAKGSGLSGLSGMKEITEYEGLNIYRPLLQYSHDDLITYCKNHNLQWIEDPSNQNDDYARPRLRKALKEEGLDTKRFLKTLSRLSRAENALDIIADQVFLSSRKLQDQVEAKIINLDFDKLKSYPLDIQIRVLQKAITKLGNVTHNYPPKLDQIESIIETIRPNKSATLYGCLLTLSKDGKTLEIKKNE